jgi:hypothetical protein
MVEKKSVDKSRSSSVAHSKTEKILIENFVALQKVMTDFSSNFEILNRKITSLLTLFEDSAKALVRKDLDFGKKDDPEIIDKLNELLGQNKIIAKGLTLMYDSNSSGISSYSVPDAVSPIPSNYSLPSVSKKPEMGVKKAKVLEESEHTPPKKVSVEEKSGEKEENLPFKVPEMPKIDSSLLEK